MTIVESEIAHLDPDNYDMSVAGLVFRRVTGQFPVDEWGYDADMAHSLGFLARLRWAAEVVGADQIPEIGPALIVHNCRLGLGEPLLVADSLGRASGRPIRFSGAPDTVVVGPLLRRIGGVPGGLDDLRVLLRSGEIVSVSLGRELMHPFHAGPAPMGPVDVALRSGAPLLPVAVSGFEPGRHRRIVVGEPIVTRRRANVLTPDELAVAVRGRVQELLNPDHRK